MLALAVAVGSLGGHLLSAGLDATERPLDWLAYLLIGVGAAVLVARHRAPIATLAATGAMVAALFALDIDHQGPFILLPMLVALHTAVERGHRTSAVVVSAVVLATFGALVVLSHPAAAANGTVGLLWASGWIAAAIVTGEVVRNRRDYLRVVEDRASEAERTREQEAQRRASEERLRIARELHDVLGHSLSVINVRAGVAAHVIEQQPEDARDALEAIRATSKQALEDLRSTLGAFPHTEQPAPRRPTPTIAHLDELVRPIEQAGIPVEVSTSGAVAPLPAAVDRAAYRIVQESLTNILRHAHADRAAVILDYGPDDLTLEITDTGTVRVPRDRLERGRGVAGMRERATAMGGRLEVDNRPGGGIRVRARLPLGGPSA